MTIISAGTFTGIAVISFPSRKSSAQSSEKHLTVQKQPKQTNVIFDLNGVLFRISKRRDEGKLVIFDMLSYTL